VLAPAVLEAEHSFRIEPIDEGSVRFVQAETFRGLLTSLFHERLEISVPKGFEAMNEALKRRAEGPRDPAHGERRGHQGRGPMSKASCRLSGS
jgi:hypothetical protein